MQIYVCPSIFIAWKAAPGKILVGMLVSTCKYFLEILCFLWHSCKLSSYILSDPVRINSRHFHNSLPDFGS